jgi:16S rRNA processing protein RimM
MVIMGHVINAFGIHGWIRIYAYTEHADSLLDYKTWWLGNENRPWQQTKVITGRSIGLLLDAKLENCNDRDHALLYKGLQIAVPRESLPKLPDNGEEGYYWSDLIGSEVVNLNNETLGTVIGLLETGTNDVLRVQDSSNKKKELLIPFIEQKFIIEVALKYGRIVVDWEKDY